MVTDYRVVDPVTNEVVEEYETIGDAALSDAIARASEAHERWRGRALHERAEIIRRVGDLHIAKRAELGAQISLEMGKTPAQGAGEVAVAGSIYRYYADNAQSLLADEPIELLGGKGSAVVRRDSLGVLLGIMPWNYPTYQIARFAAPNLLIGNPILLKPAPQCPASAELVQAIMDEAGIDRGVYTTIYATNDQAADVIADPRVRGVSLTGSGRAGAAVAEVAGRHLKKVVLELGGSDPFVVLSSDDLDGLVENAVGVRVSNAGQMCNAAKRFIVIDELYEQFLEKFTAAMTAVAVGDPKEEGTRIGPLSSAAAADRLEDQVRRAVQEGATLVAGGKRDGNYFEPTVLTDISPENAVGREEFFGPVAAVYRVSSEAEAVSLANDTDYGLGSYVFSEDTEQAMRVANQIEAGMVYVNCVDAEGVELPFGGVKASGFGRELGRFGIDEFVNKKLLRVI